MFALALADDDPLDPRSILRDLPAPYHDRFLAEYEAAAQAAHHIDGYPYLHDVLRLWRWNAGIYSDPAFDALARAAKPGDDTSPLEQAIPKDLRAEYGDLRRRVIARQMTESLARLHRMTAVSG